MLVPVRALSPRPSPVPPREQPGALAQPRLFAKSSFSSAKTAFSRGYVFVIKSPEHRLFIAEIKMELFLFFMAQCVYMFIHI